MLKNELDESEIGKCGKKTIVKYIIFEIVLLVYVSIVVYFENKVGYISFEELTQANIFLRFIQDALVLFLPAILVLIWFRKRLDEIGIKKTEIPLCAILLGTYILFFFLRGDYASIEGCYKFFSICCLQHWARNYGVEDLSICK